MGSLDLGHICSEGKGVPIAPSVFSLLPPEFRISEQHPIFPMGWRVIRVIPTLLVSPFAPYIPIIAASNNTSERVNTFVPYEMMYCGNLTIVAPWIPFIDRYFRGVMCLKNINRLYTRNDLEPVTLYKSKGKPVQATKFYWYTARA